MLMCADCNCWTDHGLCARFWIQFRAVYARNVCVPYARNPAPTCTWRDIWCTSEVRTWLEIRVSYMCVSICMSLYVCLYICVMYIWSENAIRDESKSAVRRGPAELSLAGTGVQVCVLFLVCAIYHMIKPTLLWILVCSCTYRFCLLCVLVHVLGHVYKWTCWFVFTLAKTIFVTCFVVQVSTQLTK